MIYMVYRTIIESYQKNYKKIKHKKVDEKNYLLSLQQN